MLRTSEGAAVISLTDMKTFLRVDSSVDDALITSMIVNATLHAEAYCQRDLRASTYTWLTTDFGGFFNSQWITRSLSFAFEPISETTFHIRRSTVQTVTTIEHLVNDSFVTISTDVYYVTPRLSRTYLLLKDGQGWPTTSDDVEDNVRIVFVMRVPDNVALAVEGIKRHVAIMYEERGDCGPDGTQALGVQTAKASGAEGMYQSLQIPLF